MPQKMKILHLILKTKEIYKLLKLLQIMKNEAENKDYKQEVKVVEINTEIIKHEIYKLKAL